MMILQQEIELVKIQEPVYASIEMKVIIVFVSLIFSNILVLKCTIVISIVTGLVWRMLGSRLRNWANI